MVDPRSVMPEGDPSLLFQAFLVLNFLLCLWLTYKLEAPGLKRLFGIKDKQD